jgi:nicotinate-nucleotide adenylyltransferase
MRYGVFGGTFDPPHNGHLALAQAALEQLNLDRVLWVVTADPPHKQETPLTPVRDRLDMVTAAINGRPQFDVSRVDIDRLGPHWAADTVALLKQAWPGDDLVYLMGSDSLRDLPTWGRPREILANSTLGVLQRPGVAADLAHLEQDLPGLTKKVAFVSAPRLAVSSHDLRRRVAAGQRIDDQVPAGVAALIQDRGLYRN